MLFTVDEIKCGPKMDNCAKYRVFAIWRLFGLKASVIIIEVMQNDELFSVVVWRERNRSHGHSGRERVGRPNRPAHAMSSNTGTGFQSNVKFDSRKGATNRLAGKVTSVREKMTGASNR